MNLHSLAVMIDDLAALDPWAAALLDLGARAGLILLLAFLLAFLARRFPAAWRHLIWHGCITALLLLPLFMTLPPLLEIPLSRAAESAARGAADAVSPFFAFAPEMRDWRRWLPALWLLPALLLALYTALGLLRVRLLTRASEAAGTRARAMLAELLSDLDGGGRAGIRECAALRAPVSWGLLRPLILLPAEARAWPDSQLRHVLLHELAHIGRLDWLSQLSSRFACALYWYNPLVWFAARRLAEEAECASDDAVLLHGQCGGDYAGDLLAIARQAGGGRRALIAQSMADSFLGRRLAAILDKGIRRDASEGIYLIRGLLVSLPLLAAVASAELVPGTALPAMNGALLNLIPVNLAPVPSSGEGIVRAATRLPERPAASSGPPALRQEEWRVEAQNLGGLPLEEILAKSGIEAGGQPAFATGDARASALRPLRNPLPDYPDYARARGLEGFSLVEYDVTARGEVSNAVVVESSPAAVFDRSSLKALREYRYEPQRVGGEAVTVRGVRTRFVYKLRPAPD